MILKLLACLMMLLDHIGLYFFPFISHQTYYLLRLFGRFAFPIFAWQCVIGMKRTHSIIHYLLRLFVAAVLTQALLELAFYFWHFSRFINVLFTFALGLALLLGLELMRHGWPEVMGSLKPSSVSNESSKEYIVRLSLFGLTLPRRKALVTGVALILLALLTTILLNPDYAVYGLAVMFIFYCCEDGNPVPMAERHILPRNWSGWRPYIMMTLLYLLLNLIYMGALLYQGADSTIATLQLYSTLAVPLFPLAFLGKKPGSFAKYSFYVFYPTHLIILMALSRSLL